MGSLIQVPIDDLYDIGSGLTTVKSDLEAVEEGASLVEGFDPEHGQKLVDPAVADFHEEWRTSREELLEAIGSLGDTSTSIASSSDQLDTSAATGYRDLGTQISEVDYRGSIDRLFTYE
ncbi:hypothetical protein [Dietzia cercidiphylli]|uniref:hypothetical protein n=1 Tax=Dietzia cercidiphylli TaxID=498199 RepID=UPI00223B2895|nr:hypothetical protein [Dietzia cercidiphylli]MCT1515383.1 hypothetical protein [Dietzia cercidiphylli]